MKIELFILLNLYSLPNSKHGCEVVNKASVIKLYKDD